MKTRKNRLNNLLKFGVFLFGISLLLWNCEKENYEAPIENIKSPFTQRIVKISDIPDIKKQLPVNLNSRYRKKTSKLNDAIFNEENILEVIDTLNNTNYSFNFLLPNSKIGEFYNLIISKDSAGNLATPFVFKYVCDSLSVDNFITHNNDLTYFKGTVSLHKYTDFFEDGYFDRGAGANCPPELDANGDPVPCEVVPIDTGGSGGASSNSNSNSDGGTTSGSYSWSSTGGGSSCYIASYTVYTCWCNGDLVGYHNHTSPISVTEIICQMNRASSGDCPPCATSINGGVGINTVSISSVRLYLKNNLTLNGTQLDWINNVDNIAEVSQIYSFLKANDIDGVIAQQYTNFTEQAISAWINNGEVDFQNRLIFNQSIYEQLLRNMSTSERQIYDNELNSAQKYLYLKSAVNAYIYAETHYPQPVRNRKGDAIKHAFWNALSTVRIGEILTKRLTDAHEEITYSYPNHHKETEMDFFNNEIGRGLANGSGLLYQLVEQSLTNGNLRYLSNLALTNGTYLATNNSVLIPTNQ